MGALHGSFDTGALNGTGGDFADRLGRQSCERRNRGDKDLGSSHLRTLLQIAQDGIAYFLAKG
jgi:hypothetical protein